MLALAVIGQPPSMSKQNKSIKVYLDIVLSSTFVCLQLKDFDSGNIFLRERLDYEKVSDPTILLTKIEEILNIVNINLYSVLEPKLIFDNDYYALVPELLYQKGKEKTYLKFNTQLENDDYVVSDNLKAINTYNIYLPYANINNYLIDKFEKLEFYHFNTVLINRLVNKNDSDSCYCLIEEGFLKILILKKREILFFNSFSYNSLDDVLYFLILALQDKSLKNSTLPVKVYSKKDPEEIKNKFKSFLKNMTVIHHDGFNQIL